MANAGRVLAPFIPDSTMTTEPLPEGWLEIEALDMDAQGIARRPGEQAATEAVEGGDGMGHEVLLL